MTGALVYNGKPCKYGHPGLRYASTGACVECQRKHGRKRPEPPSPVDFSSVPVPQVG